MHARTIWKQVRQQFASQVAETNENALLLDYTVTSFDIARKTWNQLDFILFFTRGNV